MRTLSVEQNRLRTARSSKLFLVCFLKCLKILQMKVYIRVVSLLRPWAVFVLCYRLANRQVINEVNLLKLHGKLLTIRRNCCCKCGHVTYYTILINKLVGSDYFFTITFMLFKRQNKNILLGLS